MPGDTRRPRQKKGSPLESRCRDGSRKGRAPGAVASGIAIGADLAGVFVRLSTLLGGQKGQRLWAARATHCAACTERRLEPRAEIGLERFRSALAEFHVLEVVIGTLKDARYGVPHPQQMPSSSADGLQEPLVDRACLLQEVCTVNATKAEHDLIRERQLEPLFLRQRRRRTSLPDLGHGTTVEWIEGNRCRQNTGRHPNRCITVGDHR